MSFDAQIHRLLFKVSSPFLTFLSFFTACVRLNVVFFTYEHDNLGDVISTFLS